MNDPTRHSDGIKSGPLPTINGNIFPSCTQTGDHDCVIGR